MGSGKFCMVHHVIFVTRECFTRDDFLTSRDFICIIVFYARVSLICRTCKFIFCSCTRDFQHVYFIFDFYTC